MINAALNEEPYRPEKDYALLIVFVTYSKGFRGGSNLIGRERGKFGER